MIFRIAVAEDASNRRMQAQLSVEPHPLCLDDAQEGEAATALFMAVVLEVTVFCLAAEPALPCIARKA